MKTLFALTAITVTSFFNPAFAADKYEIDKSHTNILFYINHLGFSDMIGEFTDYDGYFTFDQEKPEDSKIEITLKPAGIRTSSAKLDSELQGDNFFKSSQFPTITFTSDKIKSTGEKSGNVSGVITMLGVSKPVILKVNFNKADYHPLTKDFVAGFSASTTIKRSVFGMNSYLPMVGDDVRIEIQIEGINVDRKKQEAIQHR